MDSQPPSSAFSAIEQKLSQLTSLIHDINRMTPTSIGNSPDSGRLHALSLSRHNSINGNDASREHFQNGTDHSDSHDDPAGHVRSWDKVLSKLEQLNVLLKAGLRAQIDQEHPRFSDTDPTQNPFFGRADPSHTGVLVNHPWPEKSIVPEGFDPKIWKSAIENDMLAPSEEECAALFRSWLWSVYPILPIVSPSVVLQKYHDFHQWYRHGLDRGEPNPDPSFMPFIVFIWYAGYAHLSEKAKRRWFPWAADTPNWMRGLRARLEHYLEVMKIETTPSIYPLIAAVSSHALAVGGQDIMKNHTWNILNLRVAQSLGVHNERTLKDLSVHEAEARRRLWWETLSLDTSLSTVSGMPVVLDERYTDTKTPSELKESCMGTQDAIEYEAHLEEPGASPDRPDDPANWQTTSLVSVYHLVARARHILTVATKKVLKANMSASPMTMDELKQVRQSMQQVGDEVRKIINRIQTRGIPEHDFVPPTTQSSEVDHLDAMGEPVTSDEINYFLREESAVKGTTPITKHHRTVTIAFHKWARIMLSMSLDRLDCISYAPFLKNSKSRLWSVARNCALRSCHGYMRKFLCLAEDPELRMFRWAWASSFHPMHATIIMLIDVHDRPHSEEASRSRAMIDKIFSLISLPKIMEISHSGSTDILPLKEGGEEAWTMLRKLRHKAWQKAGLDPDVLWTEEDQTSVGVGKPLHENDLFTRSLREDIILKHKQMKERENGQAANGLGPRFHSLEYDVTKPLRLHPSEVTPGDQVSGSVVRDAADLDNISIMPQILLLRARNDQELMPYPIVGRNPDSTTTHNAVHNETVKDSSNQHNDEVQVFHIGELIQKIQQTKRSNQADRTTPVPQMYTSLSSQPLPTTTATNNAAVCDFRTMRSVENAAYQDIFDRHSTQSMAASTDIGLQASHINRGQQVAYSYFPDVSNHYTGGELNHNVNQRPVVLREQSFMTGNPDESLSLAASIPPNLHNHGLTWTKPQVAVRTTYGPGSEIQSSPRAGQHPQRAQPALQPTTSQGATSMTVNPTANDAADTGTAMDIDFDWNRWDEMFGQFAGFAEMLMSDGDGAGAGTNDHSFMAGMH